MQLKRVVVTGLGTVNPLGNDVQTYFANLDKGVSGACMIDRFDTTLFKSRFACLVRDLNPETFGFDRKEVRKTDKFTQYAVIAADEAVRDSRLNVEEEDLTRIGVIVGSGIGGIESLQQEMMSYNPEEGARFSPFLIPKIITNIASGTIAIKYGFRGPNYSLSSACASSSHCIGAAVDMIRLGKADVMFAGGSEAPICIAGIGGFNALHALSTNNDEYLTASRPFDNTRDGFVMGEGSGVLVLEEYEHASRRGATIYAEIAGTAFSCDAHHITAPDPEGKAASEAMAGALKAAGIGPESVDYINTHGTSTKLGDIAELTAIKKVFGDAAYNVTIDATKSMTGHLLGAAGAIEAIACIHAIRDGVIPPTINFKEEDPDIDNRLHLSLNEVTHRTVQYALSNNFGFGGQNACLVLKSMN